MTASIKQPSSNPGTCETCAQWEYAEFFVGDCHRHRRVTSNNASCPDHELPSRAALLRMPPEQRRPYLEAACTPEMVAHYDRVAAEEGWAATEAQCPYCGKRWMAVHPADTDPEVLECPACGIQPEAPPCPPSLNS